ncbi:MAG: phosphotransferase [Pseudomonadota bacterium]
MSESCELPEFDITGAAQIARDLYALEGPIRALDGERDLNFLIEDQSDKFVFKIANEEESPSMLECQHLVFERLASAQVFPVVATARASINGDLIEYVNSPKGIRHACRVLPFVEGQLLGQCEQLDTGLMESFGRGLANLDLALEGFEHKALQRPLLWEMREALSRTEAYKPLLRNDHQRSLVEHFEQGFKQRVIPLQNALRQSTIHNDANRGNVLVDENCSALIGIIDFGDMVKSWLVIEPAIAATYAMLDQPEPLIKARDLIRGYHQILPLTDSEFEVLFDLIGMRLSMSVCICAHQRGLAPDNAYLSVDESAAWQLMEILQPLDHAAVTHLLQGRD